MEFSGQYLTYDEYRGLGGTLDQMPFNLLEYEARKEINLRTQNRLVGIDEIPYEVKLCVYYLINELELYTKRTSESNNKASESIDGYSVSYVGLNEIESLISSNQKQLDDIMLKYLYGLKVNGVHLIFNGVV